MSRIGLIILLLYAGISNAIAPEDGIWYNPQQPGRGWVITSQNDLMAVSTYTYAASGAPTWYLSVGNYSDATRSFAGSLAGTRDGQCIGCPYRAPAATGSAGALTIQFTDNENAVLVQAGETVPIRKYYYAYSEPDDRLYGEWSFAGNVALGIGDAEFLVFDRSFTAASGRRYVQFRRRFSTAGLGLASFEPTLGRYLALLDSSSSYYKAYQFKMEGSRILDGSWWLYRKTESISGLGDYFTGQRTKERNDVALASKRSTRTFDEHDEALSRGLDPKARDFPLEPASALLFDELRHELESMPR
jgi:hypothetical protein